MAGRGAAPKDPERRQRTNADPVPRIELEGTPVPAPTLPHRKELRSETRRWWDTWAKSPQASTFIATDWEVMLMLVPIVDEYHRHPTTSALGELRLQMAKFGATPEDRQRLRMTIKAPAAAAAKSSPRSRLDPRLKVVEGGKR